MTQHMVLLGTSDRLCDNIRRPEQTVWATSWQAQQVPRLGDLVAWHRELPNLKAAHQGTWPQGSAGVRGTAPRSSSISKMTNHRHKDPHDMGNIYGFPQRALVNCHLRAQGKPRTSSGRDPLNVGKRCCAAPGLSQHAACVPGPEQGALVQALTLHKLVQTAVAFHPENTHLSEHSN